jgi:signal peptidase I
MIAVRRARPSLRGLVHVLVLGLAVSSISVAALGRIVPMTGRQTLVVAGPSMAPALPVGSAIVIEPVDPAALMVGDVVSLKSGAARATFTHRIVRIVERQGGLWLETKGDANAAPDPSIVPASDVLGRVAIALPYAGYLIALTSRPSGMVLILAVGLFLLTASWILDPARRASSTPAPA